MLAAQCVKLPKKICHQVCHGLVVFEFINGWHLTEPLSYKISSYRIIISNIYRTKTNHIVSD